MPKQCAFWGCFSNPLLKQPPGWRIVPAYLLPHLNPSTPQFIKHANSTGVQQSFTSLVPATLPWIMKMLPEKAPPKQVSHHPLIYWAGAPWPFPTHPAVLPGTCVVQRVHLKCQQLSAKAGSHQQNCTDPSVSKGLGSAGYTNWQKGIILYHCSGLKTSKRSKDGSLDFLQLPNLSQTALVNMSNMCFT